VRLIGVQAICTLALCAAGLRGATARDFDPPPVARQASSVHHAGKMIWAELVTPDLGRSEQFYGGLFGWTFRDLRAGDTQYAVAVLNGEPVAGLVYAAIPPGEKRQPFWLTFLAAHDVDSAKSAVIAHAGKVVREPVTYKLRGRQAVFSDPHGAVFAVLASRSGDGPDFLAAPGTWIWSSLLTSDADAAAAFYQAVLGYDVFDLESEDGRQHVILSSDNYARAGVNALPIDSVRRYPHWLNFVRVLDSEDAASKAVALGGSVLVRPHVDRHGGKLAVIADPTGAPFGIMEWADADSKDESK
jgi:predicted enzyme related to lactoylglutathione lyase